MMTNNICLKPNFDLLNSNFDGYKLKFDPNQIVYNRQIENGIFQRTSSDTTCYLFTRMESLHNHLFCDPFEPNSVYLFNKKGHLLMFTLKDGYVGAPTVVWQEDLEAKDQKKESAESSFYFSPSLCFSSSRWAVTSDGQGLLNILQTGDRNGEVSWLKLKDFKVSPGSVVGSLVNDDVAQEGGAFKQELHALILSVISPEDLKKDRLHSNIPEHLLESNVSALHIIYWLTFGFDGQNWERTRERRVAGFKCLEYLSLDQKARGIVMLSHDNFCFIYDSLTPVEGPEGKKTDNHQNAAPKYMFMQNKEEIKLWVNIGPVVSKEDLVIEIKSKTIKIQVRNNLVLEKTFSNATDSYASTWKVEHERIEICVPKTDEGVTWSSLFEEGDAEGEELVDSALVEKANQRLANLTSDQWNPDPNPENPVYNPGQLEACDDASEDLYLSVLDGATHATSHSAHLGAVQHLFNVQLENTLIPSFCLRHDVDGLLWQLGEDRSFEHTATFHAFGYVKASKAMAKFTRAAPDNSYVAVSDVKSHVYVFCQPGSLGGELRNRKTGKTTTTVARQLIISLKNHDEVMGIHAAPNAIFVLTAADLFVYTLQTSL